MQILRRKTTTHRTQAFWSVVYQTDEGDSVATATALLDAAHPLGRTSLMVQNQELFEANREAVQEQYSTLISEVAEAAEDFVGMTTEAVGDAMDGFEATPDF